MNLVLEMAFQRVQFSHQQINFTLNNWHQLLGNNYFRHLNTLHLIYTPPVWLPHNPVQQIYIYLVFPTQPDIQFSKIVSLQSLNLHLISFSTPSHFPSRKHENCSERQFKFYTFYIFYIHINTLISISHIDRIFTQDEIHAEENKIFRLGNQYKKRLYIKTPNTPKAKV